MKSQHNDWETSTTVLSTGERDPFLAAWYLTRSRIWRFVRHPLFGPAAFGIALWLIIVATVVLSPATDSHFIYTDF